MNATAFKRANDLPMLATVVREAKGKYVRGMITFAKSRHPLWRMVFRH
jgi:hypothetical protein